MRFFLPLIAGILVMFSCFGQTAEDSLAVTFANKLQKSLYNEDLEYFSKVFNDSVFYSYFIIEDSTNYDLRRFNRGFKNEQAFISFASELINNINHGYYYNLVNYSDDESGNYYLLYRLFGENGLNYHEYYIEPDTEGNFYIADIYNYLTGEYLSETFKSIYIPFASTYLNESDAGEKNLNLASLTTLEKIKDLIAAEKIEEAREIFNRDLPPSIKKEKISMIYELQLLDFNDTLAYNALLDTLLGKSQRKTSVFLISMDKFFIAGNYNKMLEVIDSLNFYVNDDFLDLYRGNAYYAAGEIEMAITYFEKLANNFSSLPEAYESLLTLYNETLQVSKFVEVLDMIHLNLDMDYLTLVEIVEKEYPDTAKDSVFKSWQASKFP